MKGKGMGPGGSVAFSLKILMKLRIIQDTQKMMKRRYVAYQSILLPAT